LTRDQRVADYAQLLVERCVDVQPGWQVGVSSAHPARPLVVEVIRLIARRGAHALPRMAVTESLLPRDPTWAAEAPEELLRELPPLERTYWEEVDADIVIYAPENTREGSDVSPERQALLRESMRPIIPRILSYEIKWVACMYPTPAIAQDAGMSTAAFEDFLYGACLRDWDAEGERMRRIADRFDSADEVRIVGVDTDLTFSLEGRHGKVDAGDANMPAGEVFYSPVEDSANGVVTFGEYPAWYGGHQLRGVRFRFQDGLIVEASADNGEDFLLTTLDTDEGARRLGEFGIGCNEGIDRAYGNPLFDEKIYGTIHLAIGAGFPLLGGTNESAIHWDIVKELRNGGEIRLDGEVVQRNGEWQF
jgi:aminopeptidase